MLNIKMDHKLKSEVQKVAKEMGLLVSALMNNAARKIIETRSITFQAPLIPNTKTAKILDKALKDIKAGKNLSPVFNTAEEVDRYLMIALQALKGFMVIGTFSDQGPKKCSMLDVHQYTEEELDELSRIDDEFLSFSRAEEISWRKRLREELPKTPQGWLEIFPEAKHLVKPVSRKQKKFREQLEIARDVDLESVVEQYVDLKRSGAYRLVGLCPFHDEKTPSFTIFKNDDHFYCFGCREYGDVIKFIRLVENLTFKQAVKTLWRFSQQN